MEHHLGKEDFRSNGVPVSTIGCLQERGLELEKAMYIDQVKADELERYKLTGGDFLFSRMASVGRAAIVDETLHGYIFNYHLMRLRLSRHWILPKYFLYYVRGSVAVSQMVFFLIFNIRKSDSDTGGGGVAIANKIPAPLVKYKIELRLS